MFLELCTESCNSTDIDEYSRGMQWPFQNEVDNENAPKEKCGGGAEQILNKWIQFSLSFPPCL